MSKRPYFAQNDTLTADGHRAGHFETIEQAREFLRANSGGTIKQRGANGKHYDVVEIVPAHEN